MAGDPWLARWLPLLAERAGGRPVLELGCGGGRDTATLAEAGHRVIGVELSPAAAKRARDRVPSAEIHCQDIRVPFPMTGPTGVVLASLSLHYFGWAETCDLVDRVRDALAPEGVLLCRLNSINDHHFGASGHPEIEKNFYEVDGVPKRFFDRDAIDRLFARGWRALAIGEMVIDRYDHPKSVWEAVLERND